MPVGVPKTGRAINWQQLRFIYHGNNNSLSRGSDCKYSRTIKNSNLLDLEDSVCSLLMQDSCNSMS